MQSVLAALGDLYLFKLTRQQRNQDAAWWTLVCSMTSWFTFYCVTRTLTNSTEAVLTTIALYYFPWPGKPRCVLFHIPPWGVSKVSCYIKNKSGFHVKKFVVEWGQLEPIVFHG